MTKIRQMAKAIVSILLSIVMVTGLIPESALSALQVYADPVETSGDWTNYAADAVEPEGDVYTISTAAELAWLANVINGTAAADNPVNQGGITFKLGDDIDLSAHYWTPIGKLFANKFCAVFDGNGHTIRGMYVGTQASPYEGTDAGLFGYVAGSVRNVRITDSAVYAQPPSGNYLADAGLVAGRVSGANAIVKNCDVSGTVGNAGTVGQTGEIATKKRNASSGGLVGDIQQGTAEACRVNVSLVALESPSDHYYSFGGIAGTIAQTSDSTIVNCVSNMTLSLPEGMDLGRVGAGAPFATGKQCALKNSIVRADLGGALGFSGAISSRRCTCWIETNFKAEEDGNYVLQAPKYTYYGTLTDAPVEMTEEQMKEASFATILNSKAASTVGLSNPLTWSINENENDGFPNLADAGVAEAQATYYLVTFKSHGTVYQSVSIESGQKVTKPSNPPAPSEDATFLYWYKDDPSVAYDFNTPITANTTLTAKWKGQEFTVRFNTNGGSYVYPQTVEGGETLSEPVTVRKGYSFAGWFTDSACTESWDFNDEVTSGMTLYAKWDLPVSDVSVSGRITDEESGDGIRNATVKLSGGRNAITDEFGYYRIQGVPAGTYTITASAFGYNDKSRADFTVGTVSTGYDAALTRIGGGGGGGVDTANIYATISCVYSGIMLDGVEIKAVGDGDLGTYSTYTANGGQATFTGLPAGWYTFHINEAGRPGWESYVSAKKQIAGDHQLNCALKPNYQSLKINVIGTFDPKTNKANVPLSGKEVTLIGVDPADEDNELIHIPAHTGADGSVTVEKLVPITWKISSSDFAYEEDEVIVISDGAGKLSEKEVTLTLPFIESSLSVNLTSVYNDPDLFKRTEENKDTLPDVSLAGVTGTMTEGIVRSAKPDAAGKVLFTGLFPGNYNLSANGRVMRVVDIKSGADQKEIFGDPNDGSFSRFGRKHFDVDFHGTGTGSVALGMRANATIEMDPAPVSFSGILYKTDMDEKGEISSEPLKNAKLIIKPSAYYPQSGANTEGYEITTDDGGHYAITMAPGLYGVEMESTYDGYFGGKLIYHEGNSDGYQGPWGWPCTGEWTGTKASAVAWMTGDDSLAYGDIGGMSLSSGTVVADLEIMEKKINYSACSPGNSVVFDNTSSQNLIIGSEQDEEATVSQNTNKWHKYDYYDRSYQTMNYHPETNGATLTLKHAGSTDQSINMTGKTFPVVFNELDPGDYSLDYTLSSAFSQLSPTVSWGGDISFFRFPAPGKLPTSFPENYAVDGNPWPLSTKYSGLRIDPKQGQWKIGDLYDGNDSNGEVKFKFYWADTYYDIAYVGGMVEEAEYQSWFETYGADFDPIWRRSDDPSVEREDADGYYRNRPNSADYQDYGVFEQDLRAWEEEVQELRTSRPGKWVAKLDGTYTEGNFTVTYTGNPHWNDLYENTQTIMENYLVAYSTDKLPGKLFRASGKGSGINKVLPDGNVTLYFCAPKGRGYAFLKNLDHIFNQDNYAELANTDLWFSVKLNKNGETDCLVNFLDPTDCSEPVKILSQTEAMNLLNPRTIVVKAVEEDNVADVLNNVTVTMTYAGAQYSTTTDTPMQTCTGAVTDVVVGEDAAYEWECANPANTRSTYDDATKTETFYVPLRRVLYSKAFMVKDDAGNPVANASITLTGKLVGQPITLFTGPDGKATAYDCLTYQDYDVHVTCPGYSFHNIPLTAEDVRSDEVATDVLRRDEQPEFDEDAVSINRKGAFLPGVNFSGSSNSIDFLIDTAITDAKDKPLYYTVNAKIKTAPLDSLLEVFLIDKRTFRNPDFGDVPEALATPAMDENNYNPSLAWEWGTKLEKGELGNVYYRRFSGDEPFVSQKDSHGRNVYEIEKTLPLWELPPDGFEPCLLAVTSNHAMQIYDFDYSGEAADDQLVGIRLDGDKAGMLNNITLLANAQALGGPAVEKLEELTEPTGSIIPLPSFEAGIEEEDGFLSYDYTVEMQLLQGKKSVSDAEKSYMAILPSTLGIMAKGGWKMGVDGEERKVTNSFHVTVAGKDMDALDYLPSAFEALPVKVEFDEDNPPSGTITLAAADTKDKNNHNTEEEYSLGINGQVHIVAEVSAFSSFAAVLPVGPVLASLEKSGALDIGAKVQVAVGADGTYKYKIINGEEQESEHEVEFTLGAGAGIGFYAKAFGGALGAEANLKLTGDNDKLQDMVTVSASIGTEHGFKMNRIDGKVQADAHIEMKTWLINGEKDFKFVEIPFSYQFGTETMFTLTEIQIEDNLKSRNDFEPSIFNGQPVTLVSNLLPIGGYATDEDGSGAFVYTDMSSKGGNVRLLLSAYAGNKVWNTPVAVTATDGLIPAFDVISMSDGNYLTVWSEIAKENMMMTCPPSVIRYSAGKIVDGKWSGSIKTLGTLSSEVASKLLLLSDSSGISLAALKTAEGALAERLSISGYRFTGSAWSAPANLAKEQKTYDIAACARNGALLVSYVTDDRKLHVLRWKDSVSETVFDATGSESALVADDVYAYLVSESAEGLVLRRLSGNTWSAGEVIDQTSGTGNPSLSVSGNRVSVTFTDQNDTSLYLLECTADGGVLEKTKLKTATGKARFRDSSLICSGAESLILTVLDTDMDQLNVYSADGSDKEPAVISTEPKALTGLRYNGSAQELIKPGTAKGGTIKYAVTKRGDPEPAETAFSASVPSVYDAGNYRVYYKLEADADHMAAVHSALPFVDVSISRAVLSDDMLSLLTPAFYVTGAIPAGTVYEQPAQDIVVKAGSILLIEDRDYVIDPGSILTASDFGTYTITVRGMGNYTGSAVTDWKVVEVKESGEEGDKFAHSVIAPLYYTGAPLTPQPVITWNGVELVKDTDYTLTYKNNTNEASENDGAKAPSVTVKGKGKYKDSITIPFTILRRPMDDGSENAFFADEFLVSIENKQWTGKTLLSKPVIKFVDGNGKSVTLKEKKDYTLTFTDSAGSADPKAAGTVTVRVEGTGNFTGTAKVSYEIIAKSADAELKNAVIEPIPDQYYTGTAFTQDEIEDLITVWPSKTAEKDGEDPVDPDLYTVSFNPAETLKTGKVTVTVQGTEGHGELWKTATFKILPKPVVVTEGGTETPQVEIVLDENEDIVYTGKPCKPAVMVVDPELDPEIYPDRIVPASDYTVKYTNNTSAANEDATKETRGKKVSIAPTATLTFKGNYKGTLSMPFTIAPLPVDETQLTITQADIKDSGREITASSLKPAVKLGKTTLKRDKDYELLFAYDEMHEMQEATVVLTGNYAGEKRYAFRIYDTNSALNLSDKTIFTVTTALADADAVYDGMKKEPVITVTAKVDGEDILLTAGRDYTVSCSNNVNAGVAGEAKCPVWKVTGKGAYKGSQSGSFTILPKALNEETCIITVADIKYNKGKELKPKVTVTDKATGKTLKANTDYTFTYADNREIPTVKNGKRPRVILKGKGNYTTKEQGLDGDALEAGFRIYEKDISSVSIVDMIKTATYTGEPVRPEGFGVYPDARSAKDGVNALTAGEDGDYVVEYGENTDVGFGTVTLKGVGTYGGVKVIKFTILPKILKWLAQ